jgi:hypothetical protein
MMKTYQKVGLSFLVPLLIILFLSGNATAFRGGDATGTATIAYPTGPILASDVTTPSAPQNLEATTGDGYVVLGWSAPSDDGGSAITEYKIYRGTSSGGESYLTSVSAPTTYYKDTAVTNGQTYYYQVSAVNYVGEGEKSSEKTAAPASKQIPTPTTTPPATPTTPPVTPTPLPTATPHATATPTPTPLPTATPTPHTTATPTPHATATPAPSPSVTPTPSFQELIDEELGKLSSGRILFDHPEEMKVGVKERVVVRLTKDITENLTEGLEGVEAPQIEPIEVGTFMTVKLTSSRDSFDINAIRSEKQVVRPVGFTEWCWDVTPLKSGIHELLFTVTVRILIPDQDEQKIDWLVMDKQISVEVNPTYTFKSRNSYNTKIGWTNSKEVVKEKKTIVFVSHSNKLVLPVPISHLINKILPVSTDSFSSCHSRSRPIR